MRIESSVGAIRASRAKTVRIPRLAHRSGPNDASSSSGGASPASSCTWSVEAPSSRTDSGGTIALAILAPAKNVPLWLERSRTKSPSEHATSST